MIYPAHIRRDENGCVQEVQTVEVHCRNCARLAAQEAPPGMVLTVSMKMERTGISTGRQRRILATGKRKRPFYPGVPRKRSWIPYLWPRSKKWRRPWSDSGQ